MQNKSAFYRFLFPDDFQQRDFGQCDASWMESFCLCTCNRCKQQRTKTVFIPTPNLPRKPELRPIRSVRLNRSSRARSRTPSRASKEESPPVGCLVGRQNLYQVMNGIQELRIWSRIVQLSGLREFLANESTSVTMFTPNNVAFQQLLRTGDGLSELIPDKNVARVLVSYHTVSGAATSRRIKPDLEVETLLLDKKNRAVNISFEETSSIPTRLMVVGRESVANVVKTDIVACNSVIHVIDRVLLPYEDVFPSKTVGSKEAITKAKEYTSLMVGAITTERETPRRRRNKQNRGRKFD